MLLSKPMRLLPGKPKHDLVLAVGCLVGDFYLVASLSVVCWANLELVVSGAILLLFIARFCSG